MNRDPYDDLFAELAPGPMTPDEVRARFADLAPGFAQARRRHRTRLASVAAVGIVGLILGTTALVSVLGDGATTPVEVASHVPRESPDSSGAASSDDIPSHLSAAVDPAGSGAASESSSGSTDPASAPDGEPPHGAVASSPPEDDPSSAEPEPDGHAEPSRDPEEPEISEPPDPAVADDRDTVNTPGGSATVELTDGVLTVVDHTAAPGYTPAVDGDGSREIEVKFRGESAEYKIKFEIHDGRIDSSVEPSDTGSEPDDPEP